MKNFSSEITVYTQAMASGYHACDEHLTNYVFSEPSTRESILSITYKASMIAAYSFVQLKINPYKPYSAVTWLGCGLTL